MLGVCKDMILRSSKENFSTNFNPILGQELANSYKQTGVEPQKLNETAFVRIRGDGLSNSLTTLSVLTPIEMERFNLKELDVIWSTQEKH